VTLHRDGDRPLDRVVAELAARGPLAFRALPADEQAWRGRYLLMVAGMGASPEFAWANAMAPVAADAEDVRTLVAATPDDRILDEIGAASVDLERLLPYD
jgi:hypothetical protein